MVIVVIVAGEFSICAVGFLLDQGLWMEFLGTVGFRDVQKARPHNRPGASFPLLSAQEALVALGPQLRGQRGRT